MDWNQKVGNMIKYIRQKFLIIYNHFILKPIFILKYQISLYKRNKSLKPFYFLDSNNFLSIDFKNSLRQIDSTEKIINEAELTIKNYFQTLGSELVHLGGMINWHRDFKSGRIYEKKFYTEINSKQSINGSDIKVPWELSRFHQALYLAKAYIITGDEKYSKKFFELINDWIDENPYCYGINWNCAMEVAIRSVNWILSLHIFKNSSHFTDEIKQKIFKSLYQHGIFIRNNLEYGRRNGNHYLSDLMGLIWLGAFFFNHSFGKRWFYFAKKELEKEILIQVYEDGVDYEKSTFYQRLVTEIFTLSFISGLKLGFNFSDSFKQRLYKMFHFISEFLLDDEVPNVGDCDDGRVLKFSLNEKISEMRNLLAMGSILFNDGKLKSKSEKITADTLFLLGAKGNSKYNEIQNTEIDINSKAFPKGGFYILRSKNFFMFFDAGDIGMNGWGGHGHNDILSFELAYRNKRFIVDSGTYVYTPYPEMRQLLRSTSAHNTIMIDKKEIAEFLNLFRIKSDFTNPKIKILDLNNNSIDTITIQHHAYERLLNPVTIERAITLKKAEESFLIIDKIYGKGKHQVDLFFHFHPEVLEEKQNDYEFILKRDLLSIKIRFHYTNDFKIEVEDFYYSESYGKLNRNKRIHISGELKLINSFEFRTIISAID